MFIYNFQTKNGKYKGINDKLESPGDYENE